MRQSSRKKSCDEVEAIRKFTYLGDRVSVGENVRLLWVSEHDVGGLGLGSVIICCMVRDFLYN